MSTIRDDPFFQEGQQAGAEGADQRDCPYPEGSDGQNGWVIGWRACPLCGQDHAAVFRCHGLRIGKLPKNRAAQSEAALRRWKAWRQKIKEECLAKEKKAVQDQPGAEIVRPVISDEVGKTEPKKTWRW